MKVIHETLKRRPFTSLEVIQAVLMQRDENVSLRTIQRDIESMRTCERVGYFAPIEYHRGQNGYYYTKSDYELVKKVSLEAAWSVVREEMERQMNLK